MELAHPSPTEKPSLFRDWLKDSLLFRLNIGLMASLLAVLTLQWGATEVYARYLMEDYVKHSLEKDSERVLAALSIAPNKAPRVDGRSLPSYFLQPLSGHYYRILITPQPGKPEASLHSPSLGDTPLELPTVVFGNASQWRLPGPEKQDLLILVSRYAKQGHQIIIAVAEDISSLSADVHTFQSQVTLIFLGGLIPLMGLQTWLVRTGMKALAQTQNEIARLERGEIDHLNEDVPAEIAPLVKEFNHLLSILRQRLKRSQSTLHNFTHTLKTPLTLLLQLADDPLLNTQPVLRERIQHRIRILGFLIERELKQARLSEGHLTLQPMDVAAASRDLLPAFQALYRDKGLVIDAQLPPSVLFKGDREVLLELIGNLLDNACKWAYSQVRLRLMSTSTLTLIIEDDGPGCTTETLEYLAQGGGPHLQEATLDHGLGISIANDIVISYGGAIEFAFSSDLGGLKVTVQFPLLN